MPEQKTVTLYVKPYIHKFVLAKLGDPQRVVLDERLRAFWQELERLTFYQLEQVVNDYDPEHDRPCWKLQLQVQRPDDAPPDLSDKRREIINSSLNQHFYQEMVNAVTWYRFRLGRNARDAMDLFRRHYSITEEDYAFLSMERTYQNWLHRQGLTRPRRSVRNRADRV